MPPKKEMKYPFRTKPSKPSQPYPPLKEAVFDADFRGIIKRSENLAKHLEEIRQELESTPRKMLDNLNIEYLDMGLSNTSESIRRHLAVNWDGAAIEDVEEFVLKGLCERMESLGKEAFEDEGGKTVVSYVVLERQLKEVAVRPWAAMIRDLV